MARKWPKARKWLESFVFDTTVLNDPFTAYANALEDDEVERLSGAGAPLKGRKLRKRLRKEWEAAFKDSALGSAVEAIVEGFPAWVAQLAKHYEGLPRTDVPRQIVAVPRALACGTAAHRVVEALGRSAELERLPGGVAAKRLLVRALVESLDRTVMKRKKPLPIGEGCEVVGVEPRFDWTDAEIEGHYYVSVGWPRKCFGRKRPDEGEVRAFGARIAGLSRDERAQHIEHLGPALHEGSLSWVIGEAFGRPASETSAGPTTAGDDVTDVPAVPGKDVPFPEEAAREAAAKQAATTPQTGLQPPPARSKPSLFWSMLLCFALLVGVRYAGPAFKNGTLHASIAVGVVVLCLLFRFLRRGFLLAVLVVLLLSTVLYAGAHWKEIQRRGVDWRRDLRGVLGVASQYIEGKDVKKIIRTEKLRRKALELPPLVDPTLGRYEVYAGAVDVRDGTVNTTASQLVRGCPGQDHVCEASRLLRFVADKIEYRQDPPGLGDYVKRPLQTLQAGAGDCEDQSILLASLMGSLNIPTYLAFVPNHVYPMACFERQLTDYELGTSRTLGWEDISPGGAAAAYRVALRNAQGLVLDGRYCYHMEPTAQGSWIGFPKNKDEIMAIIDPVGHRIVWSR